ncbi:MAG: DNA ligase [Candidatus Izimaplasma bacterium HR2]|nr:MAG: DNA ligase [Candidatus Izimaplasma bacterium HR2]
MDENEGDKIYWAKLDGVSALVQYVDGVYTRAFTRGDGEYGQDITNKLRQSVRKKLNKPATGYYRAEIMLVGDVHKELGYKTRRNGAAGIINRDGIEQCEYLEVLFYELVEEIDNSFEYEINRILHMVSLGLEVAPYIQSDKSLSDDELVSLLRDWKTFNVYDIDGIVIVLNESEREDTYYPELKCAFKVNEEAVPVIVTEIEWNVGRTGRVVPTIILEPTVIQGVTVERATGFNAKFIQDNHIKPGTIVRLVRSGDCIPYIDSVEWED